MHDFQKNKFCPVCTRHIEKTLMSFPNRNPSSAQTIFWSMSYDNGKIKVNDHLIQQGFPSQYVPSENNYKIRLASKSGEAFLEQEFPVSSNISYISLDDSGKPSGGLLDLSQFDFIIEIP